MRSPLESGCLISPSFQQPGHRFRPAHLSRGSSQPLLVPRAPYELYVPGVVLENAADLQEGHQHVCPPFPECDQACRRSSSSGIGRSASEKPCWRQRKRPLPGGDRSVALSSCALRVVILMREQRRVGESPEQAPVEISKGVVLQECFIKAAAALGSVEDYT